jgi:1-acyl-sn-glycerol-3-phosphate acyltransferase
MAADNGLVQEKRSEKPKSAPKHPVQKINGFVLETAYLALRLYCLLSGVRVKVVNRVGTLPKPSIILCNHGSFVDFIFVTTLLKKYRPHFIIARL